MSDNYRRARANKDTLGMAQAIHEAVSGDKYDHGRVQDLHAAAMEPHGTPAPPEPAPAPEPAWYVRVTTRIHI
jgi:hypothetical protein